MGGPESSPDSAGSPSPTTSTDKYLMTPGEKVLHSWGGRGEGTFYTMSPASCTLIRLDPTAEPEGHFLEHAGLDNR